MLRACLPLLLLVPLAMDVTRGQEQNKDSTTTYDGQASDVWLTRLTDADDAVRVRAAYALGQIHPPAPPTVAALIKAVDDVKSQEVRWYAADSLGRLGPAAKGAVPTLLAAVKDPDNDRPFSRTAAQAFGRIGVDAADAEPWLVESLRSADAPLRVSAALALWRIKRHPGAVSALAESLAEPAGETSYLASMALLELGNEAKAVAPALIAALGHPSADARRAAARVLGQLGPEVIPPLSKGLSKAARLDREAVLAALSYLIDDVREKSLYNARASREEFSSAQSLCVATALPAIITLFDDESDDLRSAAARTAAKIGLPAVPLLLACLTVENERVRSCATEALMRLENNLPKREAYSPHLATLQRQLAAPLIVALGLKSDAVRGPALRLFAELTWGDEARQAVPLLRQALRSEDPLVRRNAAKALEDK